MGLREKGAAYVCEACGRTFPRGRSDEAAIAEYKKDFGAGGDEPPALVCDDCYKAMVARFGKPWPLP